MNEELTPDPRDRGSLRRFWLEHGDAKLGLEPRPMLVGRSSSCDVMIGDARVSRRHARLLVAATRVSIEDLSSANGVYVNGQRITGIEPLDDGDQILIGGVEFVLKSEAVNFRNPSNPTPATTPGGKTLAEISAHLKGTDAETPTVEAYSVEFLGTLADKCIALGRVDEAERMLGAGLRDMARKVHRNGAASVPANVLDKVSHYAVVLADATRKSAWLDFAIDLFTDLERPLPTRVVDQMYATARKAPGMNVTKLRDYVRSLKERANSTPTERFATQRLDGLIRLLSST